MRDLIPGALLYYRDYIASWLKLSQDHLPRETTHLHGVNWTTKYAGAQLCDTAALVCMDP